MVNHSLQSWLYIAYILRPRRSQPRIIYECYTWPEGVGGLLCVHVSVATSCEAIRKNCARIRAERASLSQGDIVTVENINEIR